MTHLDPLQSHSLILKSRIARNAQIGIIETEITESSKPEVERDKRDVLLDNEVGSVNLSGRRSSAVEPFVNENHHRIRRLWPDVVRKDVDVERIEASMRSTSHSVHSVETRTLDRAVEHI